MQTSQYQRAARKKFQGRAPTPGPEAGPRKHAGSDWEQTFDR